MLVSSQITIHITEHTTANDGTVDNTVILMHPVISGLLASVRETGRSETWRQYHFILCMQEKFYIHICTILKLVGQYTAIRGRAVA